MSTIMLVKGEHPEMWGVLVASLFPFCIVSGAQTDPKRGAFRTFAGFFGLKIGRWKTYDKYPELVLLHKKKVFSLHFTGMTGIQQPWNRKEFSRSSNFLSSNWQPTGSFYTYELYAMDPLHDDRILINRTDHEEKHEQMVRDMCALTGLPWVSYSPFARFPKKRLG